MISLNYAEVLSFEGLASALLSLVIFWFISLIFNAIRNLYFHPLSSFSGSKLWIAFPFTQRIPQIRGKLDMQIRDLADSYEGVIRTGPNELIFTTAKAWKDIYGHGHPELPKALPKAAGMKNRTNIINANAKDHFRLRRAMLPAFSDRALDQQEPLIRGYVDLLVERLKEVARSGETANMVKWYTFCTFDLIGDLAYGKSFGGLAEGKSNQWVENIDKMMRLFPLRMMASAVPVLSKVIMFMVSDKLKESRKQHIQMTTDLAMQRIQNKDQEHRGDFMDFMMRAQGKEHELTNTELASNANTIIVAGSETTATLLSGVTYYLLRTPETYRKCVDEVRSAFTSNEDINFKAASSKLPYMLACLNEALRLFPPVPAVMFRHTLPSQMTEIDGHQIPGDVSQYSALNATMDRNPH